MDDKLRYWGQDLSHCSSRIPWSRKWQPIPVFLPREFHGQRSLVGYSPCNPKESDTTEHAQVPDGVRETINSPLTYMNIIPTETDFLHMRTIKCQQIIKDQKLGTLYILQRFGDCTTLQAVWQPANNVTLRTRLSLNVFGLPRRHWY